MNSNQETNNSNNLNNNGEPINVQPNFSSNTNNDPSQSVNTNQQYINPDENIINNNDINEYNSFSKKAKILMIFTLIAALIIFFDEFITRMDWYWNLMVSTVFTHDDQLKQSLETFRNLIEVFNWIIVWVITIVSIIFIIKDKKQKKNISIYEWYITAGLFHVFIGTTGITSLIYSISTLIISIKNKDAFINENSKKTNKFYLVFSLIITVIFIIGFIGNATGLFDKIEDKIDDIKENIKNRDKTIEDKDTTHVVTTFDKFIKDWGNDITKNKAYKIKNIKLNNITASLYIDYTYKLDNGNPISTITFKHGDNEIYTYTDKKETFNVSYLNVFDNFIIYGASKCDNVNDGDCQKHFTYSQVLAFYKDEYKPFYDNTEIPQNVDITVYNDISLFSESENKYADPYNDFRAYNIYIKNNYIYFDTIAEEYDLNFEIDSLHHKNNCNSPYWISLDFDMQRTYKTKFNYDEKYKFHEIDNLQIVNSINYKSYCNDKNVIEFK